MPIDNEENQILPEASDEAIGENIKEDTHKVDILPEGDKKPEEELAAKEQVLKEFSEKEKRWEMEKELLEKRIKDTQNEFHKSRDKRSDKETEKETNRQEGETLEQYKTRLSEMLSEDPAKAIGLLVEDIAKDKYISEQRFQRMIADAEERAYQRALRADPSRAEMFEKIEALEEERPDLVNLTFEQKLEFVKLREGTDQRAKKNNDNSNERRAQDLLTQTRTRATSKNGGLPKWVEDPEILKEAKNMGFTSKAQLLEYAGKVRTGEL